MEMTERTETKNTDLYYHSYYTDKLGYQAEVFTDYNSALEFLNEHQQDYVGTVWLSSDRKRSSFSDMRNDLPSYLDNLESETAYQASVQREFHPVGA
jgi:hypothetical protein